MLPGRYLPLIMLWHGHEFRPGTGGNNSSYNRQDHLLAAEINARAGDMVTSINKDIVAHTATVHGGFDVAIEMNTSASLVLTKAGIVEYYCRFHPT